MAIKVQDTKKRKRDAAGPVRPVKEKKFPLLETVTGILIFGIILFNSTGHIGAWWGALGINDAADDLIAQLNWARNQAIRSNHQVRVVFNPAGNNFVVQMDKNNNDQQDAGENVENYSLDEGIVFSTQTGGKVTDVWNSGPVGADPIQIEGGGHALTFTKQGSAQHSSVLYLMRQEDVGTSDAFFRAVRIGPNGAPQTMKYNPETSSWE